MVKFNKTYKDREWIWSDFHISDLGEGLHDYIRMFFNTFKGESTPYINDDCSVNKAITKKKDMLSE